MSQIPASPKPTDDLRIQRLETLNPPSQVIGEAPSTSMIAETVGEARQAVHLNKRQIHRCQRNKTGKTYDPHKG